MFSFIYLSVYAHIHAMVCVWKSEDNVWEFSSTSDLGPNAFIHLTSPDSVFMLSALYVLMVLQRAFRRTWRTLQLEMLSR